MARLVSIGDFPFVVESLGRSETVQATANISTGGEHDNNVNSGSFSTAYCFSNWNEHGRPSIRVPVPLVPLKWASML